MHFTVSVVTILMLGCFIFFDNEARKFLLMKLSRVLQEDIIITAHSPKLLLGTNDGAKVQTQERHSRRAEDA